MSCSLNDLDYVDPNLFLMLSVYGISGVITYFLVHLEFLESILQFYNKMEQAKTRGLVQATINWGTSNDGEIVCGDLECFWEMYNGYNEFYKTIVLAVTFQKWYTIILRQENIGIYNCCLFTVPFNPQDIHPIHICGCNVIDPNNIKIEDSVFEGILRDGINTVTAIPPGNISKTDLDNIISISINANTTVKHLSDLSKIECMENLIYLQIKDSPNKVHSINLCNNLKLEQLILNSNNSLRLIILPQSNSINSLDLKDNLKRYKRRNPLILDNIISLPCDVDTTDGPWVIYNGKHHKPGIFTIKY